MMGILRKTGVSSNAVWRMKHKSTQTMTEREDQKPLMGLAQVDDINLGGFREGTRGRGAEGKTPFVAALETTDEWLPHKIKLLPVAGFRLKAIENWYPRNAAPGRAVYNDGLSCFGAVAKAGCAHVPAKPAVARLRFASREFRLAQHRHRQRRDGAPEHPPLYEGKYAQRNTSKFEYRFNRRNDLPSIVPRLFWAAARAPPILERLLR